MFVKIMPDGTDEGPRIPVLLESDSLTWEHITDDADEHLSGMNTGDYIIGDAGFRIALCAGDVKVLLDSGVVYIMNNEGKTIDTISC